MPDHATTLQTLTAERDEARQLVIDLGDEFEWDSALRARVDAAVKRWQSAETDPAPAPPESDPSVSVSAMTLRDYFAGCALSGASHAVAAYALDHYADENSEEMLATAIAAAATLAVGMADTVIGTMSDTPDYAEEGDEVP